MCPGLFVRMWSVYSSKWTQCLYLVRFVEVVVEVEVEEVSSQVQGLMDIEG